MHSGNRTIVAVGRVGARPAVNWYDITRIANSLHLGAYRKVLFTCQVPI